jgi:hypothetical protein
MEKVQADILATEQLLKGKKHLPLRRVFNEMNRLTKKRLRGGGGESHGEKSDARIENLFYKAYAMIDDIVEETFTEQ